MLYYLLPKLIFINTFFNVFRYLFPFTFSLLPFEFGLTG